MGKVQEKPFGIWQSPITKELLAGQSISLQDVMVNESTGNVYHLEGRPSEGGRSFIVEHSGNKARDVLPTTVKLNVRSAVHEYGGAPSTISTDGSIVFTDLITRSVFRADPSSGETVTVLEGQSNISYAAFDVRPNTPNCILSVREEINTVAGSTKTTNSLVAIDASSRSYHTIAEGNDFYSNVHFNPAGDTVCWTEWSLKDMPWTGSMLYIASWEDGQLGKAVLIAGQSRKESISQPRWGPDGSLFCASDRNGYWKLYCLARGASQANEIIYKGWDNGVNAEFSSPEWLLGGCTYVPMTMNTLLASYTLNARNGLILIDLQTNSCKLLDTPYNQISTIRRISDTKIALIGSTAVSPTSLYELDVTTPDQHKVLAVSANLNIPHTFYSEAEEISYPSKDGSSAYAWFHGPRNPEFSGPPGSLPPLIVSCHGGPTTHTGPGLSLTCQYWTSRGYAYADVNYGGSSGYGRAYRDALNGEWGVRDIDDIALFASHITEGQHARADKTRVGIVGGSAGGYAVLQSLVKNQFRWAAGISLYGVGNLALLEGFTHKFESRYTELLLLPSDRTVSEEEKKEIYEERSPYFHAGDMKEVPVLLLQGQEDKVVPKQQAEEMAEAIREAGGVVSFPTPFEGEGHGFRKEETIIKALELQEEWWGKYLIRLGKE